MGIVCSWLTVTTLVTNNELIIKTTRRTNRSLRLGKGPGPLLHKCVPGIICASSISVSPKYQNLLRSQQVD